MTSKKTTLIIHHFRNPDKTDFKMDRYYIKHKKGFPLLIIEEKTRIAYVRFVFETHFSKPCRRSVTDVRSRYLGGEKYTLVSRSEFIKALKKNKHKAALLPPVQLRIFQNEELF